MSRMIDADAMLSELRPVSFEAEHSAVLLSDASKMMQEWVERQPTITIPEIVYCQNCVHYEDGCVQTGTGNIYVCPNDSEFFCEFGRKKDGNTTD